VKNVIKALPFKGELCRKWAASKDEYEEDEGRTVPNTGTDELLHRQDRGRLPTVAQARDCNDTSPFAPIWIAYILEHRK
jgi:hypothetical protein